MVRIRSLWSNTRAASAAEFALVLPLLLLLLFAVIDAGRFMWEYNRAEKATQVGARLAVVTDIVASSLISTNYIGQTYNGVTLTQGDRIPVSALATVTCNNTACSSGNFDSAAFQRIVTRMQYMSPAIQPSNVVVEYRGSGLGFAGDPDATKPQISPLVTVKLTGMTFRPLAFLTFAAFQMPDFATTLTAEDLSGTDSN